MKIKALTFLISSLTVASLSAIDPTSVKFMITNENVDYQRLPMGLGSIYLQNDFGNEPNTYLGALPKNPGESEVFSQQMILSQWNAVSSLLFIIGNADQSGNTVYCDGVLPFGSLPKQVNVSVSQHSSGTALLTPIELSCQVSFTSAGGN